MMIYPSELTKKWTHHSLSDVVEFLDKKRKPITQKDRVPGPYPYYGANGQQDSVADFIFDEPLILLAEDGGHFGDPTKTIAYQVEGKCWVNNHAHVLRPKENINIRYLCRHLERYDITSFITGSTRGKLTKSSASIIPIALPTLEEQRRIAAILDKADAVRRKRKQAIALTEDLLRSAFLDMFGDPVTNPKGWKRGFIADIAQIVTDGTHHTPERSDEGIYLLSARNIQEGYIDISGGVDFIPVSEFERLSKRYNPNQHDVLISCSGSVGRVTVVRDFPTFSIVRSVAAIRTKPDLLKPEFLESLLHTPYMKSMMKRGSKQSSQANLFQGAIKELPVIIPPISIQENWEKQKKKIRNLSSSLTDMKNVHDNLFNSLLQRAFRGEL